MIGEQSSAHQYTGSVSILVRAVNPLTLTLYRYYKSM